MRGQLPLSIILATTDPWPDLANCLKVLGPQVAAVDGEIIVGDGHGEALDSATVAASDRLSWVRLPGASVFELRARAVEQARGEIVALTEDHCVVGDDWCQQILAGFRLNPAAMGVTGPVLNGSNNSRIDRANYLHTFGSCCPPMNKSQRKRCPPPANVAFRRTALGPGPISAGSIELAVTPRLFNDQLICVHEGMTVTHVQSHGFLHTMLTHFDNGRSTTGLHRIPLSRRQLPWNLFRDTVRAFSPGARSTRSMRATMPLVFLLSCCHAAGEIAGILAGPGRSPARLR